MGAGLLFSRGTPISPHQRTSSSGSHAALLSRRRQRAPDSGQPSGHRVSLSPALERMLSRYFGCHMTARSAVHPLSAARISPWNRECLTRKTSYHIGPPPVPDCPGRLGGAGPVALSAARPPGRSDSVPGSVGMIRSGVAPLLLPTESWPLRPARAHPRMPCGQLEGQPEAPRNQEAVPAASPELHCL